MNIKVTADSTCDLSPALLKQYRIDVAPLYVFVGEKSYRDGVDIRPEDIFRNVENGGNIGSTAAASQYDYEQFFRPFSEQYDAVIHINLSSDLSASHQNARLAAESFPNVYPVDSRNLSTGSGHLALDACEMAERGMDAASIVRELQNIQARVEVSFILDTLEYLKRGGRCSALVAYSAHLLKLHPCIEVRDGAMGVGRKYRGTLESSLKAYVQEKLTGRNDLEDGRVFITYTRMPESTVDAVEREVRRCFPFKEVHRTEAGCTIANHCGPGCLGILYKRKA